MIGATQYARNPYSQTGKNYPEREKTQAQSSRSFTVFLGLSRIYMVGKKYAGKMCLKITLQIIPDYSKTEVTFFFFFSKPPPKDFSTESVAENVGRHSFSFSYIAVPF